MNMGPDENLDIPPGLHMWKLRMEQTEKPKGCADKGLLEKIKLCLSKKPLPSPSDRRKFDHDFAISTSFHGVHNIVRNQSKIRKLIWLVVVLGSVSLVVWQIYSRLVNYFTWPTTTSIEVQYVEKIEFPAVTFCNLNSITEATSYAGVTKKGPCSSQCPGKGYTVPQEMQALNTSHPIQLHVAKTKFQMSTSKRLGVSFLYVLPLACKLEYSITFTSACSRIEFPHGERFQTDAAAKFSIIFLLWNIVSKVLHLQEIRSNYTGFKDAIDFLASYQNFSITEFVKKNGFYLNSSTLLECDFFGKPCGPQDFAHVFTEYGNCFTFNHGENIQARKKVSVSGRGLSLLFNVNQEEFTDDPALGFVDAGIIFVIHSPKKVPQIDGLGLSSPVGMHARVTIRQVKTVHQEYPWGECNPNIKLQNFSTYSTSGCLKECKAQHIQEQCGCLPFLLPGNGIECDLQKFYNCVSPALDYIEVKELCTVGKHNSSCPVPCEETEYPATVSYSTFPSQKALKYLSKKLNQTQEYIRENLVNIEINYSDLNYKITQQQKAVSVSELLADLGGQLGLFCGASMITIIEIIEYIFTNFYWICILFLLKIPEMTQGSPPPQHHLRKRSHVEEC